MATSARPPVPLAEVAFRLGVTYRRAYDLLLTRKLAGRKDEAGRWVVEAASLDAYQSAKSNPRAA